MGLSQIFRHHRTRAIIAETLLAFCLFVFDPLGLAAQKGYWIDNSIAYLSQYWHWHKPDRNGKIAVVLIDETSLADWQLDWPISYGKTAEIIHALACAKASGVFFDYTASKNFNLAAEADVLLDAVGDSSAPGPPLCMDRNVKTDASDKAADAADKVANAPDKVDYTPTKADKIMVFLGKTDGIVTQLGQALDRIGREFNINTGPDDGIYPTSLEKFPKNRPDRKELTPAFGIYPELQAQAKSDKAATDAPCAVTDKRVKCHSEPLVAGTTANAPCAVTDKRVPCQSGPPVGKTAADVPCAIADKRVQCHSEPLALVWGARYSHQQSLVSRIDKCRGRIGPAEMLGVLIGLADTEQYEICPPILTLKAQDLFRDKSYIDAHGDPALQLKGRFVFVGTKLAGLNDQVFSPVHGYLAGVYKHAIALSNLMMYEGDYPTVPQPWQALLVVAVMFGIIETGKELLEGNSRKGWLLAGLVLLCALALIGIILCYRWPVSLFFAFFGYFGGSVLFLEAAGGAYPPAVVKLARKRGGKHV